jgi:predicted nucleic acid-binding protein
VAVALDADAVIGFLDRSDSLHEQARDALGDYLKRGEHGLVVSAVTYAEVLTGALLGHQDEALVRGFFADLISEVIPVDAAIAERAARLRADARLRMPDALVLATAERSPGVATLLTGDRRIAGIREGAVKVRLLSG